MPGARQPIELLIAKGAKHLTKAEIEARRQTEIAPCADDLTPPKYLTGAQKKQFTKIASQLDKLGIMGETDVDALARYVVAQSLYEQATKQLTQAMASMEDMYEIEQLSKLQDRYCKQSASLAAALGLTITSRCKLVVPPPPEEKEPNKFEAFLGGGTG